MGPDAEGHLRSVLSFFLVGIIPVVKSPGLTPKKTVVRMGAEKD